MKTFDYSFLKNGMIPARFVNEICDIATLNVLEADWKKKNQKILFSKLAANAKVLSVKGSNAIEGFVASDKRIVQIVRGESEPHTDDEAAIAGYGDALNLVLNAPNQLPFNEQTILRLHSVMMAPTAESGGLYKQTDNVLVEVDGLGNRNVRFTPLSAEETPRAMEQLVLAYMDARDDYAVNQLLLIPCVILDFLCIHPFSDGNGRLSRLLSLLLLDQSGYDVGKYVSFESEIHRSCDRYYETLRRSSLGWTENEHSYFPFMDYFLTTLCRCYQTMKGYFAFGGLSKTERIKETVSKSLCPLSKRDICNSLPDVSKTTVEAVPARMVKEGIVEKTGRSVDTKYEKKDIVC